MSTRLDQKVLDLALCAAVDLTLSHGTRAMAVSVLKTEIETLSNEVARLREACQRVADEIDAATDKAYGAPGPHDCNVSPAEADSWMIALRIAIKSQPT